MSKLQVGRGVIRKSFGKIKDIVPVPNLIEIQSKSFNDFVQLDYLPEERENVGLEKVLKSVFPIHSHGKMSLEFVSYELGVWSCTCGHVRGMVNRYTWKCASCKKSSCSRLDDDGTCTFCTKTEARYIRCDNCLARVTIQMPMTIEECRFSGQTYSMPLKIKVQLISWSDNEQGEKFVQDVKEQDIFFADIPVMAGIYDDGKRLKLGELGTFLINGVDRVIVSQLHRSPGAVFSQSKKVKDFRGRPYYLARIIPMRGSWLDFEFDSNDHLYVRIDKKKKILVTVFLQALGYTRTELLPLFYTFHTVEVKKGSFYLKVDESLIGQRLDRSMFTNKKLEEACAGKHITQENYKLLSNEGIKELPLHKKLVIDSVVGYDVEHPQSGELLVEQGQAITENQYVSLSKCSGLTFNIIQKSGYVFHPTIATTLAQDKCFSEEEALKEVHVKVWPGDSSILKEVKERLFNLFFNERFYDLTRVGRVRMNMKLGLTTPETVEVLTKEDIIETIRYLVNLRERGEGVLDDIDHLGNRRVRLVGELLGNQVYMGFLRIERIVRERFRLQETNSVLMPQDFLNVKPLSAAIREFFCMGQLSQFMDQTNPLAGIAHQRRFSALGPGGIAKERATYEIRDVHISHYGRICPVETPEGQTVGLISSLATYANVNDLGFIETAYRPVKNRRILDEVVFLDAFTESKHIIVEASSSYADNMIDEGQVFARYQGNFLYVDAHEVEYVDLSPKQLVSVSSAAIPFIAHDDPTRALMGANMGRQAVPLIDLQVPTVATGIEKEIVKSSGAVIVAKRSGVVAYVSSRKIIIKADENQFKNTEAWIAQGIDIYPLRKFERSSYSTWIHHSPIVHVGDRVEVGDILTNGPAIKDGELALGSNLLLEYMSFFGFNFEDAII
ncbi:MAG: hypothetical protein WBQ73_03235, partial [Candidatus Babeliales bacterium]